MIARGHVDGTYAHYFLNLYLIDSNATIGSNATFLQDLKVPPISFSRLLFQVSRNTSLYKAVLIGKDICLESLLPSLVPIVGALPLPPKLNL